MDKFTAEQKKALQYDSHSIVTANAGSGKTKVFSFRFVNIALGITLDKNDKFVKVTDTPPDIQKLVAITYTDKAASELYTRIVAEIDSRISSETNADILKQLYRLRREIISANISTIHSFCMRLLKKFPIKANLDPNFTPVDSRISDDLIEESTIELFEKLNDEDKSSDLRYLIRIFGGKDMFTGALQSAINKRTDISDLTDIYSKSDYEIALFFSDSFCELRSKIVSADKIEQIKEALIEINNAVLEGNKPSSMSYSRAEQMKGFVNQISDIDSLPLFAADCIENGIINKNDIKLSGRGYLSGKIRESLGIVELTEELLGFACSFAVASSDEKKKSEEELARFGKTFLSVFNELNSIYQRKKDENGFLDFEDLLLKARDLIKDDTVCEDLKKEIDYIMIDEYQDTNQLQYDLFIPILSELNKKLSRGNLFVVGDEKQSIYMFRNADLKIFNNTHQDIVNSDGVKVQLPHSFRMGYNNCLFTNILFSGLFASKITDDNSMFNEVLNAPLICGLGKDSGGIVEFGFVEKHKDEQLENNDGGNNLPADPENKISEEELVAGRIIDLLNNPPFQIKLKSGGERNPEYRDIAVLCRKRDSFTALEDIFVKYGIPYLIIGGQGFYSSQIVKDFFNYLSFLLNKDDDRALAGILRSPFFSLSDAALFEISLNDSGTLWKKIKNYNKENELKTEIQSIVTVLKKNINYARCFHPAYVIRKILSESPYAGVISARENGVQDNANLEKLINIAHNFGSGGLNSLYDFVDFLKDSMDNNPDENQAAVVSDQNCVKIMSVHQSKGLEFPAVFLFNCHEKGKTSVTKSKDVNISREFGILTKVPGASLFEKYLTPPLCSVYDYIQRKREEAELKRLLYVAVTRAADFLFISSTFSYTRNGEINFPSTSFIGMIENGLFEEDKFVKYINQDNFILTGDIGYKHGDNIVTNKNVGLKIPLLIKIELHEKSVRETEKIQYDILLDEITDYSPSEEIFTATKYADFIKGEDFYYSKYVLGLEENLILKGTSGKNLGALKGSLMHNLLSNDEPVNEEKISGLIDDLGSLLSDDEKKKLQADVLKELKEYHSSETFKYISEFKDYKNEYELWYYNKEHHYFLHGFLDRIIFNGDEAIILDYKTNSITKESIPETAEGYLPQLKFYAVLLSKINRVFKKIRLKLLFTKFPDETVEWCINTEEVAEIENDISNSVEVIRKLVLG